MYFSVSFSPAFVPPSPAPACRSGEIPRYLAGWNALSPNHLRLVWNAARESAHESIRHAVLQLLQNLFPHLPKDQLDLVNGLARGLPKGEFDGRTLVLLKHLASASMKVAAVLGSFCAAALLSWMVRQPRHLRGACMYKYRDSSFNRLPWLELTTPMVHPQSSALPPRSGFRT